MSGLECHNEYSTPIPETLTLRHSTKIYLIAHGYSTINYFDKSFHFHPFLIFSYMELYCVFG